MGKKTIQVWRSVATQWEDAMSLWFSFFVLTIDHLSSSISSFLKFVPVSRLYLDQPSRHDGLSSNLEVDHRKWEPYGSKFTFQWVLLVFPFYESTCHASFWFTIVSPSHIFSSQIVCPSSKWIQSHQPLIRVCLFCHVHLKLIFFHVISWHFVLTWLLSLSLSRRGIMWRSCVHDTGFCDCGGVGVSGPGVDGV